MSNNMASSKPIDEYLIYWFTIPITHTTLLLFPITSPKAMSMNVFLLRP